MRTTRQIRGANAEAAAVAYLETAGWHIIGRNIKVGRDEIDVLAVDSGQPRALVVVEVRSLRTTAFGAPEERVDRAKVGHLYRALSGLGSALDSDDGLNRLPRRVDLVVVDYRSGPRPVIRHLRSLEPP